MIALHTRQLILKTAGVLTVMLVLAIVALNPADEENGPSHTRPAAHTALASAAASAQPAPAAVPGAIVVPAPAPLPVSAPQAAVARWIGAKYRVAPEAIAPLVAEADKLSALYHLSPQLVIAVMAIESNFHPYIQSEAGAQGLMQVMPSIHAKRYEKFGGKGSFVDPIVSLKVGAEILRDCVKLRGGSETEALRFYFGGGAASDAYIEKVRAEQHRLVQVAAGGHPPVD